MNPPAVPGAPHFAEWNGAVFAHVQSTGWPVNPWRIAICPHGTEDERAFGARVLTEALAKKFVERWAEVNHRRIAPANGRQIMPHEGLPPRKQNGSDDRS